MKKNDGNLDLFLDTYKDDVSINLKYPPSDRFPLNINREKVQSTVLPDLYISRSPLIISGFASLDRLIEYCSHQIKNNPNSEIKLLIGHEPFESRKENYLDKSSSLPLEAETFWLERGISLLYSAKVIHMIDLLKSGQVETRYFSGGRRLHAKIYCGDEAVSLGSSNFTQPGMVTQLEANVRFTKSRESKRFEEVKSIADNYWGMGKDYNSQLIVLLEKLLLVVSWQEALARSIAELLEGEWAEQYLKGDYLTEANTLWPSQKQGIAQALTVLSNQGSVLIADATGAGKTRMGVYLIGAIRDQIVRSGRIRKGEAIMICPPNVEDNWSVESQMAGVSLRTFSHGKLSNKSAKKHEITIGSLRRAQVLCVDESHNFLNMQSNRSEQILRNIADHLVLLTATPINKSVTDLLRMADMLGADNLSPSILKAFEKMLGTKNINRQLSPEEINLLQQEIRKFTVRRTKSQLNNLVDQEPEAYTDKNGRLCRFPKHIPKVYRLKESVKDRELANKISNLADHLVGVTYFTKKIELPTVLERQGVTEEKYLLGRLNSAKKLVKYMIMSSLRSSRAAVIEHIEGTESALETFQIKNLNKNSTGNVLCRLDEISETLPENGLSIELPDWLADRALHKAASLKDAEIYREIASYVRQMSDSRELAKARQLVKLINKHNLVLAFDSRPITLAVIENFIRDSKFAETILAYGGDTAAKEKILSTFGHGSKKKKVIGLCSDSLAEGVNLQQASALLHLDMPSVVRIAEQRSGRVDRMDSPHDAIEIWWPEDAEEFALRSDERFIERFETVESLLGSNMPLPESMKRSESRILNVKEIIKEVEAPSKSWDGIDDAFMPIRSLVEGEDAIVSKDVYKHYKTVTQKVLSRVSLVKSNSSWALFCIVSGVFHAPRWVLLEANSKTPIYELSDIVSRLRERLNDSTENLPLDGSSAEVINQFVKALTSNERNMLARKKQRALDEMELILKEIIPKLCEQEDIDFTMRLHNIFKVDLGDRQPDWDEISLRWIDLIRPVWLEKLNSPRKKPLLLKDIRMELIAKKDWMIPILKERFQLIPDMPSVENRIKACIIGVGRK